MGILDILFPKHCIQCKAFGSYLCPKCFSYISFSEKSFCTVCQRAAIDGKTHPVCQGRYVIGGVFSSLVYAGVVKKMIYQFKYPPYIRSLQSTMTDFFYEGMIQKEGIYSLAQNKTVLVPIPLHATKLRKRGYNQALLLADSLGNRFSLPVVDCLERIRKTKTQVGLSQSERQENIKDAFDVKKKSKDYLKNIDQIFLIDDVVTSGSTLKEAAKILKKAGVGKVWGMTLAHG
jgi:competence protein ComFC